MQLLAVLTQQDFFCKVPVGILNPCNHKWVQMEADCRCRLVMHAQFSAIRIVYHGIVHVLDVQELCQRLRNFFSTAESSEQERTGAQEDFAITFKVEFPLCQQCIAKPGQP